MLKPEQISNAKFTPVSAGTYNSGEVDAFLGIVAEAYEQALNEKTDLIKKISILAEKVESYRKDEDALKSALLDAHKMAESVTKEANEKATALISDAEEKANSVRADADKYSVELSEAARMQAGEIVNNARNAVNSLTARAQEEADAKIESANAKAQSIIDAARSNGEKIVGNSKKEFDFYTRELNKLKSEMLKFKTLVEELCNGNIDVSEIPAFIPDEIPVFEPDAEEITAEEPEAVEPETPENTVTEEAFAEIEANIAKTEPDDNSSEPEGSAPADEAEDAPEEIEIPFEEKETDSARDDLDDFFGLFNDIESASQDGISDDIDNLLPDSFVEDKKEEHAPASFSSDIPVIEGTPDNATQDDDSSVLDDLDLIENDDENDDEDDDITSLFDDLFD